MAHVFISYSKKNRDYARKLADYLLKIGFDVWIDDRINFGAHWMRSIYEAIDKCAAFIVIMTPESAESDWVEKEYAYAELRGKPIFPLLLSGEVFPNFATIQYYQVNSKRLPPAAFIKQLTESVIHSDKQGQNVAAKQQKEAELKAEQPSTDIDTEPRHPEEATVPAQTKAGTETTQSRFKPRLSIIILVVVTFFLVSLVPFVITYINSKNGLSTPTLTPTFNAIALTANWLTMVAVATDHVTSTPSATSTSTPTATIPPPTLNAINLTANWQTIVAVAIKGATATPSATSTFTATAIVSTPTPNAATLTVNWQTVVAVATAAATAKGAP
jgi:TIR domain